MKFDVDDNTMYALGSVEKEVYKVRWKAEEQELT
jgi:hypothetical protein